MSIMLDDPTHISKGADGKLLGKKMADSAELNIRLFTVLHFYVRSSRSSALCYGTRVQEA